MKLEYIIELKDGKVNPILLEKLNKDFSGIKDCRLRVSAEKFRSKRSDAQNRWYWACVTILSKDIGYRKDELHEIIKFKLLRRSKVDAETGEVFEYIGESSSLNKMEFGEFVEGLIQWSQEMFNVSLPYPDTQLTIDN